MLWIYVIIISSNRWVILVNALENDYNSSPWSRNTSLLLVFQQVNRDSTHNAFSWIRMETLIIPLQTNDTEINFFTFEKQFLYSRYFALLLAIQQFRENLSVLWLSAPYSTSHMGIERYETVFLCDIIFIHVLIPSLTEPSKAQPTHKRFLTWDQT